MLHFEGGGESIIYLEGFRASPVRPSHKSESEDVRAARSGVSRSTSSK
jgi:hypothetical protein